MSTRKQIAANRNNAKQSTGPRTTEGQQKVAVNALRHGLTGRTVVVPSDDLDRYKAHVNSLTASLKPETPEETQLAALIADDYWRLQRIISIEDGIFAMQYAEGTCLANDIRVDATLNQARAYLDHSKELDRLALYQSRIQRSIKNSTARLEKLQADRRADRTQALAKARLLGRLAISNKTAYVPAPDPDGFEFSADEVLRSVAWEEQLELARRIPKPWTMAA